MPAKSTARIGGDELRGAIQKMSGCKPTLLMKKAALGRLA
jgi:hypothetical protein